ncbi:hypothetical protein K443DRAFT_676244 [Laccaria amethystina LaAM-08-1]|uniref:Uncharacterized protein n=1 Tax=Laccaria amethystina LaAM-08-1 TaxID=1095629 RepID=A0A0C9Y236_9AGAR|nr:hypothetical protein K443DRAFT_676244 [Laccaria amethystina LaAM-08-1]
MDLSTRYATLFPEETFWRDHQSWLQEAGYLRRPRFRRGWEAFWLKEKMKHWAECGEVVRLEVCGRPR